MLQRRIPFTSYRQGGKDSPICYSSLQFVISPHAVQVGKTLLPRILFFLVATHLLLCRRRSLPERRVTLRYILSSLLCVFSRRDSSFVYFFVCFLLHHEYCCLSGPQMLLFAVDAFVNGRIFPRCCFFSWPSCRSYQKGFVLSHFAPISPPASPLVPMVPPHSKGNPPTCRSVRRRGEASSHAGIGYAAQKKKR